jgi:hypothetical protein
MMARIIRLALVAAFALLVFFAGCSRKERTKGHDYRSIEYFDQCVSHQFTIGSLPYEQLPNIGTSVQWLKDTSLLTDVDGVPLAEYKGKHYYHPVGLCHMGYSLLASFRKSNDSTHLALLLKYIDRLIAESDEFDGAVYYPYKIKYKVHGMTEGLLAAPWYSGMAQGEILGLLTRTFEVTQDSTYLDYAHKTFNSFLRIQGEAEPWTVFVDTSGCYWVEEYPVWEPSMTLNGFIFAMYGLYDYYALTRSPEAKRVLSDCLSTVKNYVPLFRRPGKPSFYGLRFRHWSQEYHLIHIAQLRQLYRITLDPFFMDMADSLKVDFYQE